MSQRIKYTKCPTGEVRIVDDVLPPPSELVLKEEVKKVTASLSTRNGTQYLGSDSGTSEPFRPVKRVV